MGITIGGNSVKTITIDGTPVKSITIDGTSVWSSLSKEVFVMDETDYKVGKVEVPSGNTIWSSDVNSDYYSNSLLDIKTDGSNLYLITDLSYVIKFDSQGTEKWAYQQNGEAFTISLDGNHIYFGGYRLESGSFDDQPLIIKVNTSDGSVAWKNWYKESPFGDNLNGGVSSLVEDGINGFVYFIYDGGLGNMRSFRVDNSDGSNLSDISDSTEHIRLDKNQNLYYQNREYDKLKKIGADGYSIWTADNYNDRSHVIGKDYIHTFDVYAGNISFYRYSKSDGSKIDDGFTITEGGNGDHFYVDPDSYLYLKDFGNSDDLFIIPPPPNYGQPIRLSSSSTEFSNIKQFIPSSGRMAWGSGW